MGAHDAPQWLIIEWTRTCTGAGATAEQAAIRAIGERLLNRWAAPERHFHNVRHLTDVLARVDELVHKTHEPDLVRLAAWYHGAVFSSDERMSYAHRGGENEQAAAELARVELAELGLPPAAVERVAELVTALVRHTPYPDDGDCAVLCDADLAMLAGDPQRYRIYLTEVRAEYAHLPIKEFVKARIEILHKLDQRPTLFASPLGTAWEAPARQNLRAELHRLLKELAAIEAAESAGDATPEPRLHGPDDTGTATNAAPDAAGAPDAASIADAPKREAAPGNGERSGAAHTATGLREAGRESLAFRPGTPSNVLPDPEVSDRVVVRTMHGGATPRWLR
jgi:predicted metal-dependent HD superfamily phosphohydrolase